MTKRHDPRFTREQVDRILTEAVERESRDYGTDPGEGLTYGQIVQSAQEAGIDSKYLKGSAKDLVTEAGGLEVTAASMALDKILDVPVGILQGLCAGPTMWRKLNGKIDQSAFYFLPAAVSFFGGNLALLYTELDLIDRNSPVGPELLAAHLGLNLVSGIYEVYRREKNKLVNEMNGENPKEEK